MIEEAESVRADLRMHARANYQIKSIFFIIKSKEAGSQSEFLKIHQDASRRAEDVVGKVSARKQAIWAELGRALVEVAEVTRGAASVT